MSNEHNPEVNPNTPMVYQIRLKGHLGSHWAEAFEGMAFTLAANDETHITGPVADQAALYGLLRKVRDLGLPLLAVTRIDG